MTFKKLSLVVMQNENLFHNLKSQWEGPDYLLLYLFLHAWIILQTFLQKFLYGSLKT